MSCVKNFSIIIAGPSSGVSHRIPQPQWGFEGICTNDGIGGILSTDIRQNSLACHPTGCPEHPKSWWANQLLHCHLDQWKLSPQFTGTILISISPEPTTTLRDGILGWRKSSASPTQTSLHGSTTSKERRQWPKSRFRASGLELQLGHGDAVWRRKGYRLSLTASTQEVWLSMNT